MVPECSCRRCLETMLAEFSPDLLVGEIRITRTFSRPDPCAAFESAPHPGSDPASRT